MTLTFDPARTDADIAAIAELARTIWYEYYVPLIGRDQVDYMVEKFQTAAAMQQQVREGYAYFTVRRDGSPIGYTAIRPDKDGSLFVSKFYLLREARGGGTGRAIMTFIEEWARQRDLGRLWLTVNKGNPAVQAYQRLGFRIAAPIVMDIGGGFVMDDYRMEKTLIQQ
ncbi:MAG TPA: GNAT family N-acetyltransferase [Povalibacter sp.]|uniref:GNAT family N-acetyltransferase n=1 Tax=Povalibacter sp. TaxID=1962978 RepID=UPI002C83747D|nr:GNAT family N-acetyltransferase [Povalibacter sp.]HMN45770.1 GNAT family N-acetyltransferase [Povalibacter sp.]